MLWIYKCTSIIYIICSSSEKILKMKQKRSPHSPHKNLYSLSYQQKCTNMHQISLVPLLFRIEYLGAGYGSGCVTYEFVVFLTQEQRIHDYDIEMELVCIEIR